MLSFVQLYILVRYIPQEDFGIMAICTLVVSYFSIVSQIGLPAAIIQEKSITSDQNKTTLLVLIATSLAVYFLLLLFTVPILSFFDITLASRALLLVGLSIVFDNVGAFFLSHLKREIAFNKIQQVNIAASIVYAIVSISMVLMGYKLYALVSAHIISSFLKNTLYLLFAKHYIAFTGKFNSSSIQNLIRFGKYELANSFTSNFTFRLDVLIIGKFLGAQSLGVYEVMKNILSKPQTLITPILTEISFPLISKIRELKSKVKDIYHAQLLIIYLIVAPIYICLLFNHDIITNVYLGENWQAYSNIFIIICAFYLVRISGVPIGSLLLAHGRSKHLFYWNIALAIISIISLIQFSSSLKTIVYCLFILQTLYVIPNYIFNVRQIIKDSFIKYYRNILYPIIPAFIAYYLALRIALSFPLSELTGLIISIFLGSAMYLVSLFVLYKFLPRDMISIFQNNSN